MQKVVLNVAYNKVQLIDLICQYLMTHIVDNQTKLVITGKDPTPVQVWNNSTLQRQDLKTHHEEADVIIIHHLELCQVSVVTHTSKWSATIQMSLSC